MSMRAHSVSSGGSQALFSATAGQPHSLNFTFYTRGGGRL